MSSDTTAHVTVTASPDGLLWHVTAADFALMTCDRGTYGVCSFCARARWSTRNVAHRGVSSLRADFCRFDKPVTLAGSDQGQTQGQTTSQKRTEGAAESVTVRVCVVVSRSLLGLDLPGLLRCQCEGKLKSGAV